MLRHAVILTGLLAVFYFMARDRVMYGPYGYDEADYIYAVSRGLAANYLDSPTLPLAELVRVGLGRGKDPSHRTELSEMIRDSDDIVFYRHWHGPLYIDWLRMVKPLAWDEHSMRSWTYGLPIATALLMYFGALWILPGPAGQIAGVLGAVLFLWSHPVIASNELAPHELFALCATATLLLLAKLLLTTPDSYGDARKYWYAALVTAALAFCTLEVAFVLIATLLICGHAVRDRLRLDFGFAAKSIGVFVGTVILIWPAAIFKLSFVKAYLFMAYLALFRKGAWGRDISLTETWWLRFVTTPVPWIALAAAVLILVYRQKIWSPVLLPFVIYAVSMFLVTFRINTDFPRYVLPLFPAVVLLSAFTLGLVLSSLRPGVRYSAVGIICAAMFITTFPHPQWQHRDPKASAMLTLIRENDLSGKSLLVPHDDVPMIHCYFPESHLKSYLDERAIPTELNGGSFDGVIYRGDPPRYVRAGPQ